MSEFGQATMIGGDQRAWTKAKRRTPNTHPPEIGMVSPEWVWVVWSVAGLGVLFSISNEVVAQQYTVTNLGSLGRPMTFAGRVNGAGHVVGQAFLPGGMSRAFVWRDGVMTDLGTLPGDGFSIASDINDRGQVVGTSEGDVTRAFLWEDGAMTDLGELLSVTPNLATGINAGGQVVGWGDVGEIRVRVFLWEGRVATELGTLEGFDVSRATDINQSKQVVGTALDLVTFETRAFLWQDGQFADLGTLPGRTWSTATAINGSGLIVGSSRGPGFREHAVSWQGQSITDLGTLAGGTTSAATDVNSSGAIVGRSTNADHVLGRAVIWRDGQIADLNDLIPPESGWELFAATGINEAGQIAGNGEFNGKAAAFLLTLGVEKPDTDAEEDGNDPSGVLPCPSPCGMLPLMFLGLLGLRITRWRPRI